MNSTKTFALVTTSLNESRSFPKWKSDVLAQTRQPDEIVIVDSFSSDGTAEALQQWAWENPSVVIKAEKCNAASGRNLAVANSTKDIIVSTDMGCRLDPKWFEKMCQPFLADSSTDVVAGAYQVDKKSLKSAVARADFELFYGHLGIPQPGFLPSNRSVAYTKQAWDHLHGLPEDLTLCGDDLVMSMQLIASHLKVAYAPEAMVFWDRPTTFQQFWKEQHRYGIGMGEADVLRPHAGYKYALGKSKYYLYLSALRQTLQRAPRKVWNLLCQGDIAAACLLPILLYGNTITSNTGFAAGFIRGATSCVACRQRLK